jgi:hypothetical protein
VDGLTQLWAQVLEEGMKGGDGSSSEVRGGRAGVSADVERRGMASEGECRHREEGLGDAWRGRAGGGGRRSARRRPGEGTAVAAETEQGNRRAQRKKMTGETSKDSYVKLKRSKDLSVK